MVPGLKANHRVEQIVANIDIAPTILDIAGIESPDYFEGRSFYPLAKGDAVEEWRDELLYEYYWEFNYPSTPTTFALRTDNYKFVTYHGIWDLEELYNIKDDPREMNNLIHNPDYLGVVAELRQRLFKQLSNSSGQLVVPYTERFSSGAVFRNRSGSTSAEFPDEVLRDGVERDLRYFMMPDKKRAGWKKRKVSLND